MKQAEYLKNLRALLGIANLKQFALLCAIRTALLEIRASESSVVTAGSGKKSTVEHGFHAVTVNGTDYSVAVVEATMQTLGTYDTLAKKFPATASRAGLLPEG
tara:strand:- start:312 stop:620 length:309 start_codon:yes stop_codon:yes gene_type:complete